MTDAFGAPIFGWPLVLFCRADTNRSAPADWPGFDFSDTSYDMAPVADRFNHFDVFCRCRVHGYYLQVDGDLIWKPRIETIQRLPDNTYRLALRTFAGKLNLLEASPDLVNWSVQATYGPEPGDFEFADATGLTRRFFRLRLADP
jgi:hypothetical protein